MYKKGIVRTLFAFREGIVLSFIESMILSLNYIYNDNLALIRKGL